VGCEEDNFWTAERAARLRLFSLLAGSDGCVFCRTLSLGRFLAIPTVKCKNVPGNTRGQRLLTWGKMASVCPGCELAG